MIILHTTALLTWEVSIDRVAREIHFFITLIGPWDRKQTGNKTY